jgi:hypothetical protein
MAITAVSRWKGKLEDALPIARQVAPLLKRQGATSIRVGYCHSGAYTGQIYAAIFFPDWAAYGRAMQALSEDAEYQRIFAEALKVAELEDRSVLVTQEV